MTWLRLVLGSWVWNGRVVVVPTTNMEEGAQNKLWRNSAKIKTAKTKREVEQKKMTRCSPKILSPIRPLKFKDKRGWGKEIF